MATLKEQIRDFLVNKGDSSLEEIYTGVLGQPRVIRSVLAVSVKKNEGVFLKVGRGRYAVAPSNST